MLSLTTQPNIPPGLYDKLKVQHFACNISAGVMEWVLETVPLDDYLLGKEDTSEICAHGRYKRPGDITFDEARLLMQDADALKLRSVSMFLSG